MEKITLYVEGMACEHCVKAITEGVGGLKGVDHVTVDLQEKTATVLYDSTQSSPDNIKLEIEEQGYEVISF